MPSPILCMTHGMSAVDPICEVTTVLLSVPKCFSGVPLLKMSSRGGNVTVSPLSSGFEEVGGGGIAFGSVGPGKKKK
ncbi:hypothetical protein JYU34_020657, partial [Plutella xylostella]